MSLVAAGKSDARLQAYELITVVHSLSASLAQTARLPLSLALQL